MTLYAAVLAGLLVLAALIAPMRVGTTRGKWFPTDQLIALLSLVPVFGRVFGWW